MAKNVDLQIHLNSKWQELGKVTIDDRSLQSGYRAKGSFDYQILHAEQIYYEVATEIGVKVKGPLTWDKDTLFIPRFDRDLDRQGRFTRYGLESLNSCLGLSEFGVSKNNEDYIGAIGKFSTQPERDILEYIATRKYDDFMKSLEEIVGQ